jgi:hypothetical protein
MTSWGAGRAGLSPERVFRPKKSLENTGGFFRHSLRGLVDTLIFTYLNFREPGLKAFMTFNIKYMMHKSYVPCQGIIRKMTGKADIIHGFSHPSFILHCSHHSGLAP